MNYNRWKHLLDGNTLEPMDWRHVQMIHAVLIGEKPYGALNIGIANGFSSSATIEYLESNPSATGIFVDTNLRKSFIDASESSRAFGQMVRFCNDVSIVSSPAECWIIDGDHKKGALVDYDKAVKSNAKIIIIHDSNPLWCPTEQFGSIQIAKHLRADCIISFEDLKDRDKENTKRGLLIGFFYAPKHETIQRLEELAR